MFQFEISGPIGFLQVRTMSAHRKTPLDGLNAEGTRWLL